MTITIKRKRLSFLQRFYIFEIAKGLFITMRHLLLNMFGRTKENRFSWPEVKKAIPSTYRAEHRLMLRDDETIRCTACMLCATACPSNCIHIEAQEGDHPEAEKYPSKYTIDMLRCIYCGYCVEACPCDAIRMDTETLTGAYGTRADFIKDIDYLKKNHQGKSPYSIARYP